MVTASLPSIVGLTALLIGFIAVGLKSDVRLRLVSALACFIWSIHFCMIPGAATAAVLYVVMGLRYLCATWLLSKPLKTKLICLCIFELSFLIGLYYTWTGLPSFLSWLATALLTYCAFFLTGYRLRKWLYPIGGIWLIHSALVGSWPHMAASMIQLTINHFVARKLRKESALDQEGMAFDRAQ
ncbi:YgjV family protein [Propionivibrio dicarboxylicus]|uniref:Inner membrane protein n=1 Tax=Propionivibrio dicarboxylicus TaxID=83767 RepID=A0A1G8AP72_9RHOO|nr:YgjV family protein [Propionivibrio dicarboxylicus]SDH22050.1 inner membrane protein [Propionivibrio dicarboxylicus]